jgi:hypothetical protein
MVISDSLIKKKSQKKIRSSRILAVGVEGMTEWSKTASKKAVVKNADMSGNQSCINTLSDFIENF